VEFEEYVAARGAALARFASVLTGDPHAAEDLVQSALADTFRHWRRVSGEHPDAYVRRVLLNRYLRSRRRRWWGELPAGSHPDSGAQEHDVAEAVVRRDELRSALRGLAPRARAVLVLRYYADLDDAAIAQTLGITPGTVRSTASRALATLRHTVPHLIETVNGES
jgi:RNA polymerase sigma-70 factor (sigma-E family)